MHNEAIDINQLRFIKYKCENSLLDFTRYIFKQRTTEKFIVSLHHKIICDTLEKTLNGEIKRLIINLPPGFTKTELAVINYIAYGLAINPKGRFIHVSYSDDLALENSSKIKEIIESDYYQTMWPMKLRIDSKAKKKWYNEQGGGLYAVSTGGAVTGFRAGRMNKKSFSGALIIDDPIKPDEGSSRVIRHSINKNYTSTIKNRLAVEDIPIILIMQRVHNDDLSAFLLRGGSGEKWYHLEVPALVKKEPLPYPKDWTHGVPIETNFPVGPLWEYKLNKAELAAIKLSDSYVYSSQYMQRPTMEGGKVFDIYSFGYYKSYNAKRGYILLSDNTRVNIEYKSIYADTAMKIKETNDYSVFQCWGKGEDGKIYLLDSIRGKWEAYDLKLNFLGFIKRNEYEVGENAIGIRNIKVEDKASGTGLIQDINHETNYNIVGIQRDIDKVSRARSCAPQIRQGKVMIPSDADYIEELVIEFDDFSASMAHRFDDQIDATMDAIHDMLIRSNELDYEGALR